MPTPDRMALLLEVEEEVERPKVKRRKTRKLLRWPSVVGARDTDGYVVVGTEPSRSKYSKQRLLLFGPDNMDVATCLPHQMMWADDHRNIAVLGEALREIVNKKADVTYDRGSVALRLVDNRLYMMEAGYRNSLWPRYWWQIPHHMRHVSALAWAIQEETLSPDGLVARTDSRTPVSLENHNI